MSVVEQIYKLRRDFILIGLTGRTGSGCTSVANILSTQNFGDLKTEFREINTETWNNDSRKNRIVYNYMQKHWHPFQVIHASDIFFTTLFNLIFLFLLKSSVLSLQRLKVLRKMRMSEIA